MPKAAIQKTLSFVCEISLNVSPCEEGVLLRRLEAGSQMHNACLGEAMRRVNLIRQSKDFNRFQRRMDRSHRATNPDNFNPNGTVNKGKKSCNSYNSYLKDRNSKANLERKLAAHRKSLHGEFVNEILRTSKQ